MLELAAVAPLPQGAPDEGTRCLYLGRHVGEHERDRLVLDQRATELLALLGVLQGELERRPGDAQRLRAHDRPRKLERLQGDRGPRAFAFASPGQLGLELVHATEHVLGRNGHVFEEHLSCVGGADAHLLFLLAHAQALGPGRDDEARLAAGAELRLDHRHDHVDVGDAAVGDEDLLPVDDPLAVLAHGARLHGRHVRTSVRLGHRERAERRLLRRPEAGRNPGRDLVRGALGEDRRHGQPRALDGQRDAGATPGQLLGHQRRHDAGAVAERLLQEVGPVQAHLGGFLDDRPRELL